MTIYATLKYSLWLSTFTGVVVEKCK